MNYNNDSVNLPKELIKYNKYITSYNYNDGYPFTNITAYFKDGVLYKVRPFKFVSLYADTIRANRSRYVVSDGKKHDLTNIESIRSIRIPSFKTPGGMTASPTFCLEYILKMHPDTGDDRLDITLLAKAISLMMNSYFSYSKEDYWQLPKMLYKRGYFDKGDSALQQINEFLETKDQEWKTKIRQGLENAIKQAKEFYNNDLVIMEFLATTCGECSKYQGRVFSVYGQDCRFPKLPDFILKSGYVHEDCRHNFLMYNYDSQPNIMVYDRNGQTRFIDAIEYSNRPFIDERTEEDKTRYKNMINRNNNEKYKKDNYMKNYRDYYYKKFTDPNSVPKSFSAYMRKINKSK